jgi:hypothetical protein
MDRVRSDYSAKTADPSTSDGMTREGRLLFEMMATRMDRVRSDYSAKTADPSTSVDKGRAVTFRNDGDSDGQG